MFTYKCFVKRDMVGYPSPLPIIVLLFSPELNQLLVAFLLIPCGYVCCTTEGRYWSRWWEVGLEHYVVEILHHET
jgi:hypothetical protein